MSVDYSPQCHAGVQLNAGDPTAARALTPPASTFAEEVPVIDPRIRRAWIGLALASLAPAAPLRAAEAPHPGGFVTPYELATPGDLLLAHLVAPAAAGDVPDWSRALLGGLPGQVGAWVE